MAMNVNRDSGAGRSVISALSTAILLAACQMTPPRPPSDDRAIMRGEVIFFNETFSGNGRTCGTCHRAEDNFGLSPAFIATLPPDDALFVAEINKSLRENFENPRLMRSFGLIVENQDGFEDLKNNFNLRGIPHTLALRTSVASADGPRTGWSGDGAPGDGSLRAFAVGAVIQHFPKTLQRIADVDFRLPTDDELDALEAFMLSLGRQQDLVLPLELNSVVAARGQAIFLDNGLGKCNACHFNAGANGDPAIFGPDAGNLNFDTGVENLPDAPADLTGEFVPPDDGFGVPGDGEFNTPPVVEAADTGPFFHNNSVATIEGAVAFYNGDAFNNSPAGELLIQATGSGINLDATQIVAVAAFLRVINALENIRQSLELIDQATAGPASATRRTATMLEQAAHECEDAAQVLSGAGLHPEASVKVTTALNLLRRAVKRSNARLAANYSNEARDALRAARDDLVAASESATLHMGETS